MQKARRAKGKRSPRVYINLAKCKYQSVMCAALERGWRVCDDDDTGIEWNVYWTDTSVRPERVMRLKTFQRINHFPGMHRICNKAQLAMALRRMKQLFPEQYSFAPKTWILPPELSEFQEYVERHRMLRPPNRMPTFILKPERGCQGRGIYLTKSADSINPMVRQVAQKYLKNPLLIDGFKFDLRIYVLVVSVKPLRILLYREGLVRLATEQYYKPSKSNIDTATMHLTNYSINKDSDTFVQCNESGEEVSSSKRSISWLMEWLVGAGHDAKALWGQIAGIVNKTIIAAQPVLAHMYESCVRGQGRATVHPFRCFEVLGFDILIDRDLKPWIVEVNHSPSFTCDSKLDQQVKGNLLRDTLGLLNVSAEDREKAELIDAYRARERLYAGTVESQTPEKIKEEAGDEIFSRYLEWERHNLGNFEVIFPATDHVLQEGYDALIAGADDVFLGLYSRQCIDEAEAQTRRALSRLEAMMEEYREGDDSCEGAQQFTEGYRELLNIMVPRRSRSTRKTTRW